MNKHETLQYACNILSKIFVFPHPYEMVITSCKYLPQLIFLPIRRLAGIPDFISGDDMDEMICSGRLDPKVVFAYVQEVYRALKDN